MDDLQFAKREMDEKLREDLLDTEATKRLTRSILGTVQDPKMHPAIAAKAAAAVAAGKLSVHELRELLESITRNRNAITSRGAYFCASLKRLFQRHEIPWR